MNIYQWKVIIYLYNIETEKEYYAIKKFKRDFFPSPEMDLFLEGMSEELRAVSVQYTETDLDGKRVQPHFVIHLRTAVDNTKMSNAFRATPLDIQNLKKRGWVLSKA
ncbi:MAG TPA: hypothetical protein VFT82_02950 [Candidatus Paceibacterota bacterium]|nr:hypothetical protein [Candidatus Paceibacterota bacterium]